MKGFRPEEGKEEGDLIKSSLLGMEKQRRDVNAFMENITDKDARTMQQVNTTNTLHVEGALRKYSTTYRRLVKIIITITTDD